MSPSCAASDGVVEQRGRASAADAVGSALGSGRITRRRMLALGAAALPAGVLLGRTAGGQEFSQAPIAPAEARGNPEHRFWRDLLDEFPLEPGPRYFDTAELGMPPLDTLERMHRVGRAVAAAAGDGAADHVDSARQSVARFVGAEPAEIALAPDAIGAMGLVADALPLPAGATVVMSNQEPASSYVPWHALRREGRVQLRFVPPTALTAGAKSATEGAAAIVLSHVLATTGIVMPAAELCARERERGMLAIVNGSVAAGMQPLDVRALGADAYVAPGSAWLLGPQGTAFVYVRRELVPRLQPRYRDPTRDAATAGRTGPELAAADELEATPSSPSLAAGLASSLEWLAGLGIDVVRQQATALAKRLYWGIVNIPGIEVWTTAESVAASPIVCFRVTRRPNTQVADWLFETYRIRVQRIDARGMNSVRVSPHLVNSIADVDQLIEGTSRLAQP